jgi:hypothetical protein
MPTVRSEGVYDIGERKYIDIDGLTLKVPWRYGRVNGVEIRGLKTLQELKKGEILKKVEFVTKKWNGETFYVLKMIETT